jgi:hypothetical protein
MDFSSWYNFRPQKTDHGTLFFLGANGEWHSHFIVSQRKAKLCDDAETFHKRAQKAVPPTHRTLKHVCGYLLTCLVYVALSSS